ncbi:MAG: QueT transporter family protein [Synergistaceae bacterium]|nr:QueT transporter family protein [Synergistaceae bacterium]
MTALSALIAALYAGLTAALAPLSFGPVQFRVAEALTLLPFFIPEAVPGLFVGCLLSNMLGGFGLVDIILGSAATLLAAWLTARARNIWLAALPPVLVNALVVGGYVAILSDTPIALSMLYIGASQALICCGMGIPLALGIRRSGIIDRFMEAKRPRG